MLSTEAVWIGSKLSSFRKDEIGLILNVGSSTGHFRKVLQPFIHEEIFLPLEAREIETIHMDLKAADGVDIVADLGDLDGVNRLIGCSANTVICSNLLEHVSDIRGTSKILSSLVPEQGYLILTVPHSYPYHPDPIDNRFRPSVSELAAYFGEFSLIEGEIVEGESYLSKISAEPNKIYKLLLRLVIPLPRFHGWLSNVHHWCWLFKKFSATCVVLQKKTCEQI